MSDDEEATTTQTDQAPTQELWREDHGATAIWLRCRMEHTSADGRIEDLVRELARHHARGRQPALIGERARRAETWRRVRHL